MGNHATVKDVVDLRKVVLQKMSALEHATGRHIRDIGELVQSSLLQFVAPEVGSGNVPASTKILPSTAAPLTKKLDVKGQCDMPPNLPGKVAAELRDAAEMGSAQTNDQYMLPGIPPKR